MAFDTVSRASSSGKTGATRAAFLARALGRAAACVLLAGACAGLCACDQSEKTRQVMDQRAAEAQQSLADASKVKHPVLYDPLVVTNKVWSGSTALRMQHGMPLPPRYEVPRGVTLVSADPMTISDIANAISAQTGIPIRLTALSAPTRAASQPAPATVPTAPFGALPSAASGPSGNAAGGSSSPASASGSGDDTMPVSYEGTLSGLLERMSAFFGVNWRYDGSSISISRFETRIFTVEALPGTQTVNEGMQDDTSGGSSSGSSGGSSGGGTGSSGGSSGGGSSNTLTQNSTFKIDIKYWEELSQVLNSMVGGNGSVVVSPSMGTVTITTTPDVMQTVSDYLSKENHRLSRQIAINVQIYTVNLGQSEDFEIAFTSFLKNLTKFSGFNYSTPQAPAFANPALAASVLSGSTPQLGSLSIAILNGPNDPTAHAGDIFNALSTIGDTTSVAQFPMTTLNNRPVSRRVGTDTTYVSSVTQNTTSTTSTETTYTPTTSTIHDGFSLQLTPRLLDDGRILLQYSLSLIGLDSLNQTSVGGYPLALPKTDNRIFVQQSMLRSGSTLVIGGVDQEDLVQNKNGVGSPDNFLLGGGVSSNNNHLMMFMAITPQVMDVGGDQD